MSEILSRQERALTGEQTTEFLQHRLGEKLVRTVDEFGVFTAWITPDAWVEAATLCREEWRLAYDMFDSLFGVDAKDDGFDVVCVLYSTTTGNRIALRTRCDGGRDTPSLPTLTGVFRGADWMERETYDMYGIDFVGHPSLLPRLLTVDNFEGWPLRKEFMLASRVVKPWPGVAEPKELDEDGNIIERETKMGDAPGPYDIDKAIAEQAKRANAPAQTVTEAPEALDDAADDAPVTPSEDPQLAAQAQAKADDKRREQAEARAQKAAERAQDAPDEAANEPAAPDTETQDDA
ncbi:MAG: NADH-quinone oxidoreductase subunit C [Nitriliruptoraceae bacterium]